MKILFYGDSITDAGRNRQDGMPSSYGNGYVKDAVTMLLMKDAGKYEVINRGISGNRVIDLYARWKIDALNLKPDILSILIGVNDTWHEFAHQNGVEVPRYEMLYRMLLEWTKQALPDVKLVLLEPFAFLSEVVEESWMTEIRQRREVVKKLSEEFDTIFIPTQSILDEALKLAPETYWLRDGVHPTSAGHQLITEAWLKATEKIR